MNKKRKTVPQFKKNGLILAGTAVIAASTIGIVWNNSRVHHVPAYSALRIIDGDTFETTEKQPIRLQSVNAPELEYCGGKDAKEALEQYILNQPLYIKVNYRDKFNRLISDVYTPKGNVNEFMIKNGYGLYLLSSKATSDTLRLASQYAIQNKKGIHGYPCSQTENKENPRCTIKGNIRVSQKYYFPPDCAFSSQVQIELYNGDRWFCTENEAEKAGFTKASQCK